ncbi:hypothetical protein HZA85_00940 [Candidatus Uhrbacteria bacterium]|nr:hypothetical protein [Candidatus Uhrbacteria bacterium]
MRNIFLVLLLVLVAVWIFRFVHPPVPLEEPGQASLDEGSHDVPDVGDEPVEPFAFVSDKGATVTLDFPQEADLISSPLVVSGSVSGTWFFEASFPVELTDWDGNIIAQGQAQAQGDWMTSQDVPFIATLEFETPTTGNNGFVILRKDNPSGLPENDDFLEIPIVFSP